MTDSTKQLPIKKAWDQWSAETDTAYHRFSLYLEMGADRTMEKVRVKVGKKTGYLRQLEKWSSKYQWVDRCSQYDKHLLQKTLKNKEEAIDEATAKLINSVDGAVDKLIELAMNDEARQIPANNSQLKAIEMILDRAGIVEPDPEDVPKQDNRPVYEQINNYFYTKLERMNHQEDGSID